MKPAMRALLVNVSAALATAALVSGAGVVLSSNSRSALLEQRLDAQHVDVARIERKLDRIETLILERR